MSIKDRLCQHLCQVGLHTAESARFASLVAKWNRDSGPEWTVKRLKSLSDYYKAYLQSTSPPPVPSGWGKRMTRRGHETFSDGFLSRVLSCKTGKGVRKAQALIRSYQIIVLKSASPNQVRKFVDAVKAPELPRTERVISARHSIACGRTLQGIRFSDLPDTLDWIPLSHWPMPREKRSPVLVTRYDGEYKSICTASRAEVRTKDIEYLLLDTTFNHLWEAFPEEVSTAITGDPDALTPVSRPTQMKCDLPAGTIGFIQEGGAKLRSVANPFLVLQALGEPLKAKLSVLCKKHPSCHVHDQSQAQVRVAKWLSEGRKVYGFDASSWTDRLPFSMQQVVLDYLWHQGIISDFDISVVEAVVSKSWKMPKGVPKAYKSLDSIRWETGQPMGFGPSFFLATLTHIALVDAVFASAGRSVDEGVYAIVGDDIVICDEEIANGYRSLMEDLGVEINMLKSMVSRDFSEFCGKIITPGGVIPSIKTKLYTSADQVVDSLSYYGVKGYKHLTPKERAWAIMAFLPTCMGGLGFKPAGSTYAEYLNLLNVDRIQQKLLLDEVSRFYRNVPSRRDVLASLNSVSKWYDLIEDHFPFSKLEWTAIRGDFQGFSDWTGLPISVRPDHVSGQDVANKDNVGDDLSSEVNTFRELVDTAAREILSGVHPCTRNRLLELHSRVLDKVSGYIDNSEKPPLRPITPITTEAPNEQRESKIRRYFSEGFNPSNP